MRGGDNWTGELFSYVDLEARVRGDHPLRGWGFVFAAAAYNLVRLPKLMAQVG